MTEPGRAPRERRVLVPEITDYGVEPFALEDGECGFCGQEGIVLAVDCSSGEYAPKRICQTCCIKVFKEDG